MESKFRRKEKDLVQLDISYRNANFFQVVRLLEIFADEKASIKYQANTNLDFPTASIEEINEDDHGYTIKQNFLGLFGSSGVLPDHYQELLQKQLREKNHSLEFFLNIFDHRLTQLFYRAWQYAQFFINYEKEEILKTSEPTLSIILMLSGLFHAVKLDQILPLEFQIYFSGLLSQIARPWDGLTQILKDYFQLPIKIEPFYGEWLLLAENSRSKLGNCQQFNCLGIDTIIGKHYWQVQNRFQVVIGPLTFSQFTQLFPQKDGLEIIKKTISLYVGIEYKFALKLILAPQDIPFCQLRCKDSFRLGWNTWLTRKQKQISPTALTRLIY